MPPLRRAPQGKEEEQNADDDDDDDDDEEDGTRRVSLVFFVVSSRDDEKEDDVENESATTGTDVARGRAFSTMRRTASNEEKPAMQQKVLTKLLNSPRFRSGTCLRQPRTQCNGLANKTGVVDGRRCVRRWRTNLWRECAGMLLVVVSATSLPRKVWEYTRGI